MCIKKIVRKIKNSFFNDKRIAVIRLEGIIADSSMLPVASKTIELLKEVEDEGIKALVIRINSPGGTVGASQEIYSELKKLQDKGIKIVASMGDVAASGGVYVAMGAEKIIANPGTVTGSIGVIIKSGILKDLYKKIGIDHEIIKSGQFKDILSDLRHLTKEEQAILQNMVDDTYYQFISTIAVARNMHIDDVKKNADGRVFTGNQAVEYGFVDKTGTLNDAIHVAKELAGITDEPKIINFEAKKSFLQKISKISSNEVLDNIAFGSSYSSIPLWIMKEF